MKETVIKNFIFNKKIVIYLEEIAKDTTQSMTLVVEELILERYKELKNSNATILKAMEEEKNNNV